MLIKEKVEQAKKILNEFEIDCWITFVRETQVNGDPVLPFLTPADLTWHTAFVITRSGHTAVVLGKYDEATISELNVYDEVIPFVEGVKQPFQELMKKLNPSSIALNYSEGSEICDGITYGMFLTMQRLLDELGMADRIVSAEKIVSALRQRKTETELTAMKKAIGYTLEIFDEVAGFIAPGKTEIDIAAFMTKQMKNRGLEPAWEPTVCPSVFTGPPLNEAHYHPTEKPAERGHVLNMDFGVRVDGYCSDLQRTFYIMDEKESSVPTDVQMGFDTIRAAIVNAKEAMKPGVQGVEIDRIARETITAAGYPEFPHGLGHQVGRFSHDGTALLGPAWEKYAEKPFQELEPGMVFTIEPRLPVKGRGVVTIEEMVLVTETGCEWLSNPQKELFLIR